MHILAYIDPGAGALIYQAIIGVVIGMVFYLRRTRKWIGGLMGKAFRCVHGSEEATVELPCNKGEKVAGHRL
jgi:hypothetical protein